MDHIIRYNYTTSCASLPETATNDKILNKN